MSAIRLFEHEVKRFYRAGEIPGAIHSPPIDDPEFIYGAEQIVKLIKKMMKTGKPSVSYHEIIEHIAVIEAGQLTRQQGKRIFLEGL